MDLVLDATKRPIDFAYDRFAAVRHRLVARPKASCPSLPPELRRRLEE